MKKVTFVIAEPMLHEQLSIMYLSASLKGHGHETSLIFNPTDPYNQDKIVDELRAENPDFIALSFMSGMKEHYQSLARNIKDHLDTPIVVGGSAATFDTSLALDLDPFDAVCTGEGDLAFVDFIENYGVRPGPIRNFAVRDDATIPISSLSPSSTVPTAGNHPEAAIGLSQSTAVATAVADVAVADMPVGAQLRPASDLQLLIDPLDQLPFPDRELLYGKDEFMRNMGIKMFISGRGCPYLCTYCFNHSYNEMYKDKGKVIRHNSVDYFLESILQVTKDHPLDGIIFEDDIFIIEPAWLEEFAQKYPKKIGLPYLCYIRPNLVRKDIVRHLEDSGCYSVRVAIECGNERVRNLVLKRNLSDKQIINSCNMLTEAGIKIQTINMVGLPTESNTEMLETMRLNQQCKPKHVTANVFMPLPGVEITKFAVREGLLDEEFSSPKTSYHLSKSMHYPDEVQRFLLPFQRLFPLFVMHPFTYRFAPLLMRIPMRFLKAFDTLYRLFRNKRFYPPVRIPIAQKLQAFRRYLAYLQEI